MIKNILFVAIIFLLLSTAAQAQTCVTKPGFIATAFESDLNAAIRYANQHDDAALREMLRSSRAFWLRQDMKVYREEQTWDGKVQIRMPGQKLAVWTVREAIECGR